MEIIKKLISEILTLAILILGGGFLWLWYLKRKNPGGAVDDLIEKEEYEPAIEEYKKLITKYPDNYQLYCDIGYAYRMIGDVANAIASLEKAIDINPQQIMGDALIDLARAYADSIDTLDDAVALYNQAKKEFENDQSGWEDFKLQFFEIMGWISLKKEDFKTADEYYEQAYQLWGDYFKKNENRYIPAFAEVHYHFGIYFLRKGEEEKARAELSKAIKHPLKNFFAKKADEALKEL